MTPKAPLKSESRIMKREMSLKSFSDVFGWVTLANLDAVLAIENENVLTNTLNLQYCFPSTPNVDTQM